jgi:hypothetical protein
MVRSDPYTPNEGEYECLSCGYRVSERGRCPDCGGDLKNISVPRE